MGYSPEDLVSGKVPYSSLVFPDDMQDLETEFQRFRNGDLRSSFSTGYKIQDRDGRTCEVIEKTFKIYNNGIVSFHGLVYANSENGFDPDADGKEHIYCQSIVDGIQSPLLILDSDFTVLSANRYYYELFSSDPEKTEGRLFFDNDGRNWDRPELRSFLGKVLEDDVFFDRLEMEINDREYGRKILRLSARRLDIKVGRDRHLLLSIEDLTVQRMAEMELRASEEKYSKLVENGNDGILIIRKDGTLRFTNSKFSRITSTEETDILTRSLTSFVPFEYHRMLRKRLKKVLRDKRSIRRNDEIEFFNKEGGTFPAEISLSYILYEKEPSVMMTVRDISDRKRAEAELRASEEKYSTLVEKGNDGIIILQDSSFKFVNSKFSELTGHSREELIEQDIMENVPVEYKRMLGKRIKKVLKDQHSIRRNDELEFLKKDGGTFPAEISLSFIMHQERPSVMMAVRDISERKKTEAELKASEKKYSTLVEEGNDGIIVVQDDLLVFANMEFCRITGFARTEILRRSFEDFLSLEYRLLVMTKFRKSLEKNRKASFKYEIELVSKDGKNTPAEINSSIIDHEGRPAIMAIIRDITDQKEKENELLELIEVQKVLETVIKSSPAVVFFWKPDESWRVEFVSENISQFGYKADDLLSGRVLYGDIVHPSDLERLNMENDLQSGEDNLSFEYRILTRSGEVRWVDERSVIKRDVEGNVQYIQGIIVDITERKNVKNFMHIGSDMGMLLSPLGDVGDLFSQLVEFTIQMEGLDSGALYLVDENNGDINIVAHSGLSSDFIKSTRHYGGRTIQSRLFKTEYPLYTRYYELTAMIPGERTDHEGLEATALIPIRYGMELVAILMLASHSVHEVPFDVRDSLEVIASQIGPVIGRMREQAVVQNNISDLQLIFGAMKELIFMMDNDGCIMHVNPYSCQRLGYTENEIIGMNILNLYPQKRFLEAASEIKSILAGETHVCNIPFESAMQEIIPVEMRCSMEKVDGNVLTICVSREKI